MSIDVTVIIPTRDRLWCLPEAVDSCRDTACRTQIIVADDGSEDGTWEWLLDQHDVLALQTEGWGKPFAVNRAYRDARGKYLRFLDSDDWLPQGVIDGQFELAERDQADVVVAGQEIYRNDRLEETRPWTHCDDFIAQQLGECDSSHYSAFLFRREFIKDIPHRTQFAATDFASRDDRCFMIEVAMAAPRVAVYNRPGLCHRHHTNGRLQFAAGLGSVGTNIQHLAMYRQILRMLERRGQLTLRRKKAAAKVLWRLAHWVAYTHPRDGADIAEWVYVLNPEFRPLDDGVLSLLYGTLGFRLTERILRMRRAIVSPFRRQKLSVEHEPPSKVSPHTTPKRSITLESSGRIPSRERPDMKD